MNKVTISLKKLASAASEKPTILLLHGGPGMDSSYFGEKFQAFNNECTIVTYDQGFSGESSSMQDLVSELKFVVQSLDVKSLYIVGHSFGGILALEALNGGLGAKIAKVLLLCSPVDASVWKVLDEKFKGTQPYTSICEEEAALQKDNVENFLKLSTLLWTPFHFSKNFQKEGKSILEKISYNSKLYQNLLTSYLGTFDLKNTVCLYRSILSFAFCSNDKIIIPEYSKKMSELFDSIYEVDSSGHFPMVENFACLKVVIQNFISK